MERSIVENFPNMAKGTSIKIQEAQRTPLKINKNRSTPHHLIVKLTSLSDKEKILKAAWDKIGSRPIHRDLAGQKGLA